MRHYAVGDIHGQLELLQQVHGWIARDKAEVGDTDARIIHVGDYADRGPNVRGTLDYLIEGVAAGAPWICLKGNHDRMMRMYLSDPELPDPGRPDLHWLNANLGGRKTLASYGVDVDLARLLPEIHAEARSKVPQAHLDFIDSLPLSYHADGVFFCHAGIRPGVALDAQTENDLVWIRDAFLHSDLDHGALIVHGHTPVEHVTHYGNRLNIDTGAAYGGPLSAVVIEDGEVRLLGRNGRIGGTTEDG